MTAPRPREGQSERREAQRRKTPAPYGGPMGGRRFRDRRAAPPEEPQQETNERNVWCVCGHSLRFHSFFTTTCHEDGCECEHFVQEAKEPQPSEPEQGDVSKQRCQVCSEPIGSEKYVYEPWWEFTHRKCLSEERLTALEKVESAAQPVGTEREEAALFWQELADRINAFSGPDLPSDDKVLCSYRSPSGKWSCPRKVNVEGSLCWQHGGTGELERCPNCGTVHPLIESLRARLRVPSEPLGQQDLPPELTERWFKQVDRKFGYRERGEVNPMDGLTLVEGIVLWWENEVKSKPRGSEEDRG